MFTGIVEELGDVTEVSEHDGSRRLVIAADSVARHLAPGDSIAVNGCCLTVVDAGGDWCAVEVVPETLSRTTIGGLGVDSDVNLERPLAIDGRLGGHIVQGHVDGTGEITAIRKADDGSHLLGLLIPEPLLRYVVEKGSIAVDGVSLTVARVLPDGIELAIIGHTWRHTRICRYEAGGKVNIEVDILAKYIERLVNSGRPTPSRVGVEK